MVAGEHQFVSAAEPGNHFLYMIDLNDCRSVNSHKSIRVKVFFELNGVPRDVTVDDLSLESVGSKRAFLFSNARGER